MVLQDIEGGVTQCPYAECHCIATASTRELLVAFDMTVDVQMLGTYDMTVDVQMLGTYDMTPQTFMFVQQQKFTSRVLKGNFPAS